VQPLKGSVYRIPTGCKSLDSLLGGGLPSGKLTLVYGEAETGKTSLAIQCAVNSAKMGYRNIFVDADGSFIPERLYQIAGDIAEEVSMMIIVMRPKDFQEQAEIINNLDRYVIARVGLVIIDTITSLYRAALTSSQEVFSLNRELNHQVATLAEVSKSYSVPILLTSQVRGVINQEGPAVEPVATRVLKFWSDIVILLKKEKAGFITAKIEKPLLNGRAELCYLSIESSGIRDRKNY